MIYPDLTPQEIDLLQKESFHIRYIYSPFVQFEPVPLKGKFVEITANGFRKGLSEQPWPPKKEEISVFVFGGSTTFSFGLPNEKTLVNNIEYELNKIVGQKVQCYNFGRGYYFSTQERLLFENILEQGIVPDMAIFIDGLNDYYYPDGKPEFTSYLFKCTAPDLPNPSKFVFSTETKNEMAVQDILQRYKNNIKMIEGIAKEYSISVIFAGQPVPFFNYPVNPITYPFLESFGSHELCEWGYNRFEHRAKKGEFGQNFIWTGDVFSEAELPMYADSIHYSYKGAQMFASAIVSRSFERGLLNGLR